MAYRFEVDEADCVLLCRFSESVNEQRIGRFYREAGAHIERMRPRAVIFDFTEVTSFDVSSSSIRSLADAPPLIPETSCPRVVVAPAQHIYAMSRMFQILGERSRPTFKVVRSMEDALAVIRLADPDFKTLTPE